MDNFIKNYYFKYLKKDFLKCFHLFILILCIFSLAFAYIAEYFMHLSPCPLCVYQRLPFLILICASICGLQDDKKVWLNWYLLAFIMNILLAGYHTGVERGIFEMSSFCKPAINIIDNINVTDFKAMLESVPVARCDKPVLVIFALSMTEWNLLFNIFLFILTLILYKLALHKK